MSRFSILITPAALAAHRFAAFAGNRDTPCLRLCSPAVAEAIGPRAIDALSLLRRAREGQLVGATVVAPFDALPISLKTHAETRYRGQRCLVSGIEYMLATRHAAELLFVPDLALHAPESGHHSAATSLPTQHGWEDYCTALLDALCAAAGDEAPVSAISVARHQRQQLQTIRQLRLLLSGLHDTQAEAAMAGLARLRPALVSPA